MDAAVILAITSHSLSPLELPRLLSPLTARESYAAPPGSTLAALHRLAFTHFPTLPSLLRCLTKYFEVLGAFVASRGGTSWEVFAVLRASTTYTSYLTELHQHYEWAAVVAYHVEFHAARLQQMKHDGDYSGWTKPDLELLSRFVWPKHLHSFPRDLVAAKKPCNSMVSSLHGALCQVKQLLHIPSKTCPAHCKLCAKTYPTFTSTTTAEEVATVFADQIRGKNGKFFRQMMNVMNGLGFETARVIAQHANLLIITGYNAERRAISTILINSALMFNNSRLKLTEAALKKEVPSANVRPLTLDLAHLASARTAAAEVNAYSEPLHVLIHNAAAPIAPYKLTKDNFEMQMATDQIGPFLFTKLLAPKLLATFTASYSPRVVFLASRMHAMAPLVEVSSGSAFGRPAEETYTLVAGYSWAKQANIFTAIEISKRSQGKIHAFSLDPGAIFTNLIQKEESRAFYQSAGILDAEGEPNHDGVEWKTIPQGAATTVVAAFDPRLKDTPGAFLWDGCVANDKLGPMITAENAAKVWQATEDAIGEKFVL
ncbi:hypothetical protein FB45DRAFT_1030964 [Roridomyces roridus]|uniref:Uncharacterized protein n=1 Tax=Roridomyces roridus TaxID=1738132 RepID=A0AAD7BLR7_9AGAR|nr:hypothetical protein FB45DRAFT_1030964 [Roridomyces roridus]